jgi:hypothetical protein
MSKFLRETILFRIMVARFSHLYNCPPLIIHRLPHPSSDSLRITLHKQVGQKGTKNTLGFHSEEVVEVAARKK